MDLKELLNEVDLLFKHKNKRPRLCSYDYSLNKFPYGWTFEVVNDWHRWLMKELKSQFGAYEEPEYAIKAFLEYVKTNHINVTKLMSKE